MSNLELFVSQTNVFSGIQRTFEEANYVVLGVPFDATSTYRTGARFGPAAIRQASLNIETYSFRSAIDMENLRLHDAGDLNVSTDAKKTIDMIAAVVEDIIAAGKTPITMGGEHTITLGIAKGLGSKAAETAIVSFDAHLDLRCEFLGLELSHTTFMQLISETVKPARIIEVGTRAVCKEERAYARKAKVDFFTTKQIQEEGPKQIIKQLKKQLAPYKNVYLTVDLDVLDPAFAPAVQNPEPGGIDTNMLLDIVCGLCDKRVIGFDVLEVSPVYDQGVSAIVAAKVMFEMLCGLERDRSS